MIWAPQVTAPIPLDALYSLMQENFKATDTDRNILDGASSHIIGQNIQLVT